MQQRAAYLLERYIAGSISDAELSELHQLTETSATDVQQGIREWLESHEADPNYNPEQWQQVLGSITAVDRKEKETVPLYKRGWARYAAAAAVVVIAAIAFWPKANNKKIIETETAHVAQKEVPPGKDGAILTLADGSTVVLDSMSNGLVAQQNGANVVLQDGKITYNVESAGQETVYNTMTTPRGRQFNVTLPDGTRVWLNAASSLRYPTAFSGSDRKVEVTGEAYFEVAQNQSKPFKVQIGKGVEVQVLGTHFNVNAYADEPTINTTLLEGSVKLVSMKMTDLNDGEIVLKPGQQSQFSNEEPGKSVRVKHVDLDEVVAWKEGAFSFNDADLPAVMRQLSRWYNVEVEYAGDIPKLLFTGKMGRSLPLADVLAEMKDYDVKFRIEGGNKIVVLP